MKTMKKITIVSTFLIAILLLNIQCTQKAKTQVIAHRGYWWNCEGSVENSITALRKAQELKIYGSEFDVWMTSDGVLVVNHDDVIEGLKIEDTPYAQLKDIRLANDEILPTLAEYLKQGKKDKKTKLILELKPHNTKKKEDKAVAAVVKMVEDIGVKKQTEYISFSLNICIEFARLSPKAEVAYLGGNIVPHELKTLNMTVNVWTVNEVAEIKEMIDAGVDFITTNKPVLCVELLKK
jgi:glycerophosphoryl diester phosphodiesterase